MSSLRDDELSEKYFYAGCFGLPWLWVVHVMNYQTKTKKGSASLLHQQENRTYQQMEILLYPPRMCCNLNALLYL